MSCNFIFEVIDTFNNAKIFTSAILPHNKQATSINKRRVYIHDEVFEVFQFFRTFIMETQKLFHQVCLFCWQRFVIWVSAQDVFEKTFYLVDVVVFLSSEFELLDFFVSSYTASLLSFLLFAMLFSQIIDNPIVMVTVFLPELIEIFSFCFFNF